MLLDKFAPEGFGVEYKLTLCLLEVTFKIKFLVFISWQYKKKSIDTWVYIYTILVHQSPSPEDMSIPFWGGVNYHGSSKSLYYFFLILWRQSE